MSRKVAFILILVVVFSPALMAQSTVTGTVSDTTGALIPGAEVTLRNVDTNESRMGISNDQGLYRITNLPRGNYEATAEITGFKRAVHSDILVTVGDVVRLDFVLEVGEISESVTVSSEPPQVNTEEGRLSNLVDEKRVVDLPLNGRNALQLMELNPGAISNPGAAVLGGTAGGNTTFVNGQRNRANNFLLDGTDNNDQFTAGRASVNPNVDTIQEFRVSANNFSAEYGRNSASVVDVVTKTGSNAFHGSLYEFHRNDALDARTTFTKQVDPLKLHQFGGTLGGPIIKDRTFFFGSYEGLRQTRAQTQVATVETPEFRQLVAQRFPNSIANLLYTMFPAPAPTTNIQDTGQPVKGLATDSVLNTPGVVNDPNYQASSATLYQNVAQNTLDGIPDIGSASIPISETDDRDQFLIRIDHDLSSNFRFFGRYLYDKQLASDRGSVVRQGFNQPVKQRGHNATLGASWIISPTVINEARFGFSRRLRGLGTENAGVPSIGFDEGVIGFGNFPTNPALFVQNTFHWIDTVSITVGNHAIRFGGELRRIQDNSDFAVSRPGVSFYSIQDFAMDEPRAISIIGVDPATNTVAGNIRGFRFWETGFFIQDDWKLHPNFTLNLGLRHDWFGRPSEVHNLLTNLIPGPGNDIFERVATATVGQVDQVVPNDLNNFAPRLGFAWDPAGNHKFTIRGGVGVGYDRLFDNSITNIRFNAPFYAFANASPVQVASQAGIPIVYGPYDANGNPTGEAIRIDGPNTNLGAGTYPNEGNIIGWNPAFGTSTQSLRVPDPATRDSYTTNWFFGTQWQFATDWVLEANYVGNSGKKFGLITNYNTVRGDLYDGSLDRLNSTFGSINFRSLGTSSIYHSGQFSVKKRFSQSFSFQSAYTWGRAIDTGSDVQIGGSPMDVRAIFLQRAVTDFDVNQRIVFSALWELPFLKTAGGFKQAVLGGWQINSIVSFQTGFPFTVNTSRSYGSGGDFNGDGQNNDRPHTPSFGNLLTGLGRQDYINGLFKASDFPTPARTLNDALGNLGRNTYRGPGYANTDFSLFKNVKTPWFTSEGAEVQFRAEFFNLFNRTNLGLPTGNMARGTFGRSTQAFSAREIQLALKLIF